MTIRRRSLLGPLWSVLALGACARHESAAPPVPAAPLAPAPPPATVDAPAPVPEVAPPPPPSPEKPAEEHHHAAAETTGDTHAGIGKLQVDGGLTRADVDKVLRGRVAALHGCYDGAVPPKGGRVDLALTISDRGWVTLGEVKRSTLGGGDPELCIVKKLQELRFPHAAEGKEAKVTFSLELRGGRAPQGAGAKSPTR